MPHPELILAHKKKQ
jgi:hypothetical protein